MVRMDTVSAVSDTNKKEITPKFVDNEGKTLRNGFASRPNIRR